jgi:hypothetical protein
VRQFRSVPSTPRARVNQGAVRPVFVVAADVVDVDVAADYAAGLLQGTIRHQLADPVWWRDGGEEDDPDQVRAELPGRGNGLEAITSSISAGRRVMTGTSSENCAAIMARTRSETC